MSRSWPHRKRTRVFIKCRNWQWNFTYVESDVGIGLLVPSMVAGVMGGVGKTGEKTSVSSVGRVVELYLVIGPTTAPHSARTHVHV